MCSEIAIRLGEPPEAGRVSADVVRTADGRCGETRAGEKAATGVQRLVEGRATRNGTGGIGWYSLAQNRQMWRRLVHAGSGDGRALPASPSRRRPPQQQQPLQLHENTCYNFISTHPWVGPTPWWHQGWWWNKGAALHDRRPPYLEKQWR